MTTEGIDGNDPIYRERLWPSFGMWVFLFIMTSSLGIAYGRAYGLELGIIVGVAATLVATLGAVVTTPLIQVDELNFRVGKARLPLKYVGKIQTLDAEQSRRARSTDADTRAHFQLRGGIKFTLIVEVTDSEDPHPYWQISTRSPDALVAALNSAKKIDN
jgi:hypothetical protein